MNMKKKKMKETFPVLENSVHAGSVITARID